MLMTLVLYHNACVRPSLGRKTKVQNRTNFKLVLRTFKAAGTGCERVRSGRGNLKSPEVRMLIAKQGLSKVLKWLRSQCRSG